jgi:hypothetical protein
LQALKATIKVLSFGLPGSLLTRISEDGRIVIPKLTITLLKKDKANLEGYIMEVRLDPF